MGIELPPRRPHPRRTEVEQPFHNRHAGQRRRRERPARSRRWGRRPYQQRIVDAIEAQDLASRPIDGMAGSLRRSRLRRMVAVATQVVPRASCVDAERGVVPERQAGQPGRHERRRRAPAPTAQAQPTGCAQAESGHRDTSEVASAQSTNLCRSAGSWAPVARSGPMALTSARRGCPVWSAQAAESRRRFGLRPHRLIGRRSNAVIAYCRSTDLRHDRRRTPSRPR